MGPAMGPADVWKSLVLSDAPVFIAIDYAETRRPELMALLRHAARASDSTRLRVMLISRSAAAWWTNLQQEGGGIGALLQGPATEHFSMPPLAVETSEKEEIYDEAVRAFAEKLGKSPLTIDRPDLSARHFEAVLKRADSHDH